MFYVTDSIRWNILHILFKWWNVSQNIVSPKEHLMDLNNVVVIFRFLESNLIWGH
jgi:hypothetical protein